MQTALYNSRPCVVLRKNSNGTSLVTFSHAVPARDAAIPTHYTPELHEALFDALHAVRSGQTDIAVVQVRKPATNAPSVRGDAVNDLGEPISFTEQATVLTKLLLSTSPKPNPRKLLFVDPAERLRLESFRNDRGRFCRDEKGRAVYH